jgi:signal peptidase I
MQPWWLDWTAGLFPVIWRVRAALVPVRAVQDPVRLDDPTLLVGDLILVNKFAYGVRLPVINTKLTDGTPPRAAT